MNNFQNNGNQPNIYRPDINKGVNNTLNKSNLNNRATELEKSLNIQKKVDQIVNDKKRFNINTEYNRIAKEEDVKTNFEN